MYGIVLMAAMASSGPACHCQGPVLCCPVSYGCCGVIHFHWMAAGVSGALSAEDTKLWDAYLAALSPSERADVLEIWKSADSAGRLKLFEQVKAMRPPSMEKDKDLEREVRASETRFAGRTKSTATRSR